MALTSSKMPSRNPVLIFSICTGLSLIVALHGIGASDEDDRESSRPSNTRDVALVTAPSQVSGARLVGLSMMEEEAVSANVSAEIKLVAYAFVRSDCPISHSYAPELQRIAQNYRPSGDVLLVVYCDPDETPEKIRHHLGGKTVPVASGPAIERYIEGV